MFIDSHAHLDDSKFDIDREEEIKKIKSSGIEKVISAGYSIEGSEKAIDLSNKYDFIYATVGISPNDIPQTEEELWKDIEKIEKMINSYYENCETKNLVKKIVAIGEIGLDYYWEKDEEKRNLQKIAFKKQIELANKLNLPIVIHTRDAMLDTINILKENNVNKKGVFHCCPQNMELIKEAIKLGYYISFAGPITFKNSKNADEIIKLVPLDRLLIETDSPYLAPEPVRGTRNTPINVKFVAEKVAKVQGINIQEIAKITCENVKRLFRRIMNELLGCSLKFIFFASGNISKKDEL